MELKVFNREGEPVGQLRLDSTVWEGRINTQLLSQAVAMYRANQRAGTASTKTRGDVRGGGKKPWKQKHTGRARAGSIRSPLWRHGGSIFGPRPRDFHYRLPQVMLRKALLESLKGKLRDDQLVLVDVLSAETPKTKPFARLTSVFHIAKKSVIVLDEPSPALLKSLRNLEAFALCRADNVSALDLLQADKVLVTKAAFDRLERRIRGSDASR